MIGLVVSLLAVRGHITPILKLRFGAPRLLRKPLGRYSQRVIADEMKRVRELCTEQGLLIDQEELHNLVADCFDTCAGSYAGTDSHLPSEFMGVYPEYVALQQGRKRSRKHMDFRILLRSVDEIRADQRRNADECKGFFDLHAPADMRLLAVDQGIAAELAARFRLPSEDLGIFDAGFVAFFSARHEYGEPAYRVQVLPLDRSLAARVGSFLSALNARAAELRYEKDEIVAVDRNADSVDQDGKLLRQICGWKEPSVPDATAWA
jgi:hypothetical protein